MPYTGRSYIAIDLKSFYASVECVERNLNPLDACLVVADSSRTAKTICLAVSPSLKAMGISGRPRLFEVVQRVNMLNRGRLHKGKSISGEELSRSKDLDIDYIVARPRMKLYMDYSDRIKEIYLRFVAPEDIHVYSVDEVFIDITDYLDIYRLTPHELAIKMIREVLKETGITATVGIGTNMYLCKVAMDIEAKKMPPDKDGVRIAELDEMSYRQKLWSHRPLTDFWRVGRGIARRLEAHGIRTMGDVARCSLNNEDWLYHQFGVNAELLIDHAWGWEPVTMDLVKAYRPETHSMSNGQVLSSPYPFDMARIVVEEMADSVALELVEEGLMTDQIVLSVGYDSENFNNPEIRQNYHGRVSLDHYGRTVPYHAHGTGNFKCYTSSSQLILQKVRELFDRIVDPALLIRRLTLATNHLQTEARLKNGNNAVQLNLFDAEEGTMSNDILSPETRAKERKQQEAIIQLRKRFGKNVILKGLNFADGATQRHRNQQIGGHNA